MGENMTTDANYFDAVLDASQKKVRDKWLKATLAIALFNVMEFFSLLDLADAEQVRTTAAILGSFAIVIGSTLWNLLPFYFVYHCAYKHPGTKYLTLTLTLGPLQTLVMIASELNSALLLRNNGQINELQQYAIFAILTAFTATYVWWQMLGWRIRKLNKLVKLAKKNAEANTPTIVAT